MLHFAPSKLNGLGAPEVLNLPPTASATFAIGAPVRRNSTNDNQIEEHPGLTTVTGILGFAMCACASGVPDFGDQVPVAKANAQTEYLGQVYDSGGAAVRTVTGDGTFEGNNYGIVKVGSAWYVDEDDTTNVVVTVTKELPEINAVLFKVIGSAIAV